MYKLEEEEKTGQTTNLAMSREGTIGLKMARKHEEDVHFTYICQMQSKGTLDNSQQ